MGEREGLSAPYNSGDDFDFDGQTLMGSKPSTQITPVTPKAHGLKPALPSEFNGDRTKGMAFLNSCQVYIRLCLNSFTDEQAKIVWAMSYMKAGQAAKWSVRIF